MKNIFGFSTNLLISGSKKNQFFKQIGNYKKIYILKKKNKYLI